MISKRNILNLKSRRDIYQFISENPGLHINEISKRINMPRSTLTHHLRYLRKLNLINVKADGSLKRFYICDRVGIKDQELLGLLRQRTTFKIIMYLFYPGVCSKAELAKDLKLHPSTVDPHIKKLLDTGIIRPAEVKDGGFVSHREHKPIIFKKPVGREIFYVLKDRETVVDIYRLLITHKESMIDASIIDTYNEFTEEWDRVCEGKRPKKRFGFNSTVDNFVDILEEIFHFPYHF